MSSFRPNFNFLRVASCCCSLSLFKIIPRLLSELRVFMECGEDAQLIAGSPVALCFVGVRYWSGTNELGAGQQLTVPVPGVTTPWVWSCIVRWDWARTRRQRQRRTIDETRRGWWWRGGRFNANWLSRPSVGIHFHRGGAPTGFGAFSCEMSFGTLINTRVTNINN